MTFLIPEWDLDDFECQEGHIQTLRKLFTKFNVSRCTGLKDFHFKKWTPSDRHKDTLK